METTAPVPDAYMAKTAKSEGKHSTAFEKVINSQPQLVCAAKNLHQSLMRCQWMISAQQLTGIGRFSSDKGLLKTDTELKKEQLNREMNRPKPKDISEICKLTRNMQRLGISSN